MTLDTTTESGSQGNAGQDVKPTLDNYIDDAIDKFIVEPSKKAAIETTPTESVEETDIPEETKLEASDETESTESTEQEDTLSAPSNWPKERKEVFDTLPEAAKKAWLEQSKDYERGLTKQGEKYADQRKNWEAVEGTLSNYKAMVSQSGLSEPDFIGQLVQGYAGILSDPVGHVKFVMQQAGLKPEQLFDQKQAEQPKKEETWIDPTVSKFQDKLSEMEKKYAVFEQAVQRQAEAERTKGIHDFVGNAASMKDADGNLLYPHFDDELKQDMARIIASTPEFENIQDEKKMFDLSYKMAVGQNAAKITERELAKKLQEAEADKTRRAATRKPASGSSSKTQPGKMSLDDHIANALDQFGLN
jgi:hypothetical protein